MPPKINTLIIGVTCQSKYYPLLHHLEALDFAGSQATFATAIAAQALEFVETQFRLLEANTAAGTPIIRPIMATIADGLTCDRANLALFCLASSPFTIDWLFQHGAIRQWKFVEKATKSITHDVQDMQRGNNIKGQLANESSIESCVTKLGLWIRIENERLAKEISKLWDAQNDAEAKRLALQTTMFRGILGDVEKRQDEKDKQTSFIHTIRVTDATMRAENLES